MLTNQTLYRLLAIADIGRDPYAVAAGAAALLAEDPADRIASQFYAQALQALKLFAAARRYAGASPQPADSGGMIPWTSRARRFAANLKALERRTPAGAEKVSAAAPHLAACELHQSADGNFHVLRLAENLPVPAAWMGEGGALIDHKARAQTWTVDPGGMQTPRPAAFDGLGMGWLPLHVAAATQHTFLSYSCALYVTEPDPEALAILLHVHDLQAFISDPRVRWFIADSAAAAAADFQRALEENPLWSMPGSIIRCPLRNRPGVNLEQAIRTVQTAREMKRADLVEQNRVHYAAMTPAAWRRRFEEAMAGDRSVEPLRVLGITSRMTTVLQHSMTELKSAVESAAIPRATMRIAIEPDDHTLENPFIEMIAEFKPDLIVQISRMRYENPLLPRNVPFLCWDQDNLPCMRTEAATASVSGAEGAAGDFTFVAGHGAQQGFTHLNWPKRAVVLCHLAAATHRYRPRELSATESAAYACDLSYISNASAAPETLRDQHLRRLRPVEATLLDMLYNRILATAAAAIPGPHAWNETTLRAAAVECVREKGLAISPAGMEEIILVSLLLADRVFRHETLAWIGEYAAAAGRTLRLYGAGWEHHPILAPFAAGTAAPGNELQAITLASRINLQIIGTGILHARLLDGLAAGGFFMFRRTDNDQADATYLENLETVARHIFENDIDSFAALDAVAIPQIKTAWSAIAPAYRLRAVRVALTEKVILRGLSTAHMLGHVLRLLPELTDVGFDTREEFARKASHFLEDDAARRTLVATLRRRVLEHFSYDARWRTFIEHIARNV